MRAGALVLLAVCLLGSRATLAGEEATVLPEWLQLSGWLETIQSVRANHWDEAVTSRARLRLELTARYQWLDGFVSMDAEKNWQIEDETGVEPHEAWLAHVGDGWDLRVGRQIIIWGKADGVQITDIISPPDYTESVSRDLDEIRMPVEAARFRLLGSSIDTELILIPTFKAAVLPTGDNPWAVSSVASSDGYRFSSMAATEPATSLANTEVAVKMSAYLSGLDVAASVFHTWDDYAALHRQVREANGITEMTFAPRHHRLTVFGIEFSRPWSDFVFRGETAYYKGRYRELSDGERDPLPKDSVKWLGGVDWTPGNDWSVITQLTGECILEHEDILADRANTLMATFNVSKKLLRQTLTLSNMVYLGLDDREIFNRFKVDYEARDGLHLLAGFDVFGGDDGQFGIYKDNSQLWVKVKYSF